MISTHFTHCFLLLIISISFLLKGATPLPPIPYELYLEGAKKEGWEFVEKKEGIYLLRKKGENGHTFFRSFGPIHASIEKTLFLLRDLHEAPKWTPNLSEKQLIKEVSPIHVITHDTYQMPWPATDREAFLQSHLILNKKLKQLEVLSSSLSKNSPLLPKEQLEKTSSKGLVEAWVHSSSFIFKPLSEQETFVDISASIDLKGHIPAFLAHFVQKEWPFKFIKSLEEKALLLTPSKEIVLDKMIHELKKL